jgi:hypothetical protein
MLWPIHTRRANYAAVFARRPLAGAAISVGVAAVYPRGKGWMRQATAAGIHCAFILHAGRYTHGVGLRSVNAFTLLLAWAPNRRRRHDTLGKRGMRLIETTTGDEQIKINTTPDQPPLIRKATLRSGAAQASPVKSTPTSSPIVLNTIPYPVSGPGGPSLTSRKH